MRLVPIIFLAVMLAGCAAQQTGVSPDQPVMAAYTNGGAGALAFDPPVLAGVPRLDLSRDDRGPAAYAGYQDTTTTFYYLRVDDRQGDRRCRSRYGYDREAVSETYGVSYR